MKLRQHAVKIFLTALAETRLRLELEGEQFRMAHYPATYLSQLFFLKGDVGYEIVVLYDGEQHLTRLLQPQEDLKYIFVLPHIAMAQELVLPSAVPCLFATVDYGGQEIPAVKFYSEEGGGKHAAV